MKQKVAKSFLVILALMISCAIGALQGQERLFPAQPTNYVTDVAGALSAGWEAATNAQLQALRDSTGVEVALVILPDIGDYDKADVALAIGRTWGVGAKGGPGDFARNAGLVLLVVPKTERSTGNRGHCRLEVGNGAEGWMTDARAGSLCRSAIDRGFRSNDYERGVNYILSNISERAYDAFAEFSKTPEQRAEEVRLAKERRDRIALTFVFVVLIATVITTIVVILTKLIGEWDRKNKEIEQLNDRLEQAARSYDSTTRRLNAEIQELSRFLYPKMKPAAFKKYYEREDKKEKARLAKLEAERLAREEAERKEREYWASPEGQAELQRREAARRKREQEEEEERRRRRRQRSSYYGSGYGSGGGGSSGGGFGGFGGGGGFSGGGGGSSW